MATATVAAPPCGDRGAAAVEFALVSLVFFTLVFGAVQYGTLLWQLQIAQHAANEGARLAAVGVTDCGEFSAQILGRARGADPVSVTFGPVDPAAAPVEPGDDLRVVLTWSPLRLPAPLVPLPLVDGNHQATAEARAEVVDSESCS